MTLWPPLYAIYDCISVSVISVAVFLEKRSPTEELHAPTPAQFPVAGGVGVLDGEPDVDDVEVGEGTPGVELDEEVAILLAMLVHMLSE